MAYLIPFAMEQRPSTSDIVAACVTQGTHSAWCLFVRTFQPLIASSVSRVVARYKRPDPALIDDLVQDTFLRICRDNARALRQFESRNDKSIFGLIKVIATSVALDHLRGQAAQKRPIEVAVQEPSTVSASYSSQIEQQVFLVQVETRLAETESERDRTIFWLYYRQGFSTREIAALPNIGLSQKGVESCLHRLTSLLKEVVLGSSVEMGRSEGKSPCNPLGELK